MILRVYIKGLEKNGLQSNVCLESLYSSDVHFIPRKRNVNKSGEYLLLECDDKIAFLHARVDLPQYGNIWVMADIRNTDYRNIDFISCATETYLNIYCTYKMESGTDYELATEAHYMQALDYYELSKNIDSTKNGNYELLLALSHAIMAAEDALYENRKTALSRSGFKSKLLGCNALQFSNDENWKHRFKEVFQYTTLPFYSRGTISSIYKNNYGKWRVSCDFKKLDKIVNWCENNGIIMKGHPLFFAHEETNPKELYSLSWEDIREIFIEYTEQCVSRYKNRIEYWDVINEAHDWANAFSLNHDQNIQIAKDMCAVVRRVDSNAKIIVNSSLVFGEYVANDEVCYGPKFDKVKSPQEYLLDIINQGVDFDIIGLQLYFPARDLCAIDYLVEQYARFQKRIHITELGVPAGTGRGEEYSLASRDINPQIGLTRGKWRREWEESLQAEWLERFYIQFLTKDYIDAISWWDMQDPGFMKTSPFLLRNGNPREHYYRLALLKERYKTTNEIMIK